MDRISRKEVDQLLEERQGVCVSIFIPLETEPDKSEMNRIRLKNSIKRAKEKLEDEEFLPASFPKLDLETLFQPVQELLNNLPVLFEHGRGLAIFLGPDIQRIYHLPISVEEHIIIGPRFHIKPLLPLLNEDGRFYLLALSQKAAQLWHGSQFSLEKVEVPQLPAGMADALALEDPERSLQFHTSTGQPGSPEGDRASVHHGHEADKEKKGAILRYFREVNDAVMEGLANEKAPLIIAAVDYLLPIYEEANTYPHLLKEGVSGNPDELNTKELHEKAWQTAEPYFEQARKQRTERYQEVAGTENSSQAVNEIVPAAAYGRVDTLFIPVKNGAKWGRFDPNSGQIETCPPGSFKGSDLNNLAAIKTLQNGGVVFAVEAEEMPDNAEIAAIFRYTTS